MQKNVTTGPRENAFLMELAGKGKSIFSTEEASVFWGSPHNAKVAIHRLVEKRMLLRLERGKYLVIPLEAGPERNWTEDGFVIGSALVQPAAIAYWTALKHWNWTEQIPRIIYVQTTARKKTPRCIVLGVRYEFVTVPARKFFGHSYEWRNDKRVLITDREKTLIDCADDVGRAGGIEELSKAVKSAAAEISWRKLAEYGLRFPNKAALKRLGFLIETVVPNRPEEAKETLSRWKEVLSEGVVLLQPSIKSIGTISTRWRVRMNTEVG